MIDSAATRWADAQTSVGEILTKDARRDAIHFALAPVVADEVLRPGQRIAFIAGSAERVRAYGTSLGIVDPFLNAPVEVGQRFWMFLNPNSITALRHVWEHPAFVPEVPTAPIADRVESERWMRAWAMEHVSEDYYGYGDSVGEEAAYAFALRAGQNTHIGPYESARDHIDNEWWDHWEAITGKRGQRGAYFSCSC